MWGECLPRLTCVEGSEMAKHLYILSEGELDEMFYERPGQTHEKSN